MKRSLAGLLLTLSLVVNPVTVLADDFHDLEMQASHINHEAPGLTWGLQEEAQGSSQQLSSDCEMPCCEDSDCSDQAICFVQHYTAAVTQEILSFSLINAVRDWGGLLTLVPDRELPPDNPPPIII